MFIETVERYADSVPSPPLGDVWEWEKKARYAAYEEFRGKVFRVHLHAATAVASIKQQNCKTADEVTIALAMLAPIAGLLHVNVAPSLKAKEQSAQCGFLRDIFGNPFRPVTISHACLAWNECIVVRLAQAAYDDRILPAGTFDNTRLLILADALEEAACTEEQILTHLRGGGEHYRGCWVIDLLLGKQ